MYKVYFRDFITKKLHQFNVLRKEAISPAHAISIVEEQLKLDGEVYHKPVLALVQGGKK